jgi:hypothetical protein
VPLAVLCSVFCCALFCCCVLLLPCCCCAVLCCVVLWCGVLCCAALLCCAVYAALLLVHKGHFAEKILTGRAKFDGTRQNVRCGVCVFVATYYVVGVVRPLEAATRAPAPAPRAVWSVQCVCEPHSPRGGCWRVRCGLQHRSFVSLFWSFYKIPLHTPPPAQARNGIDAAAQSSP